MTYKFRFKRRFFWHAYDIAGHRYEQPLDKMCLYFPDGGLLEIPQWSACHVQLGPDWVLAVKKDMEAKAGQSVPVKGA